MMASCGMVVMRERRICRGIEDMLTPSIVMVPLCLRKLRRVSIKVLLPLWFDRG